MDVADFGLNLYILNLHMQGALAHRLQHHTDSNTTEASNDISLAFRMAERVWKAVDPVSY